MSGNDQAPRAMCGNCRFYASNTEPGAQLGLGFCRKSPPGLFALPGGPQGVQFVSQWPIVQIEQGCGEHQPKPVELVR